MKVLVEATPIFRNRSGVGQYVYRLMDALFAIDHEDRFYLYGFLFAGKKFTPPYRNLPPNVSYRLIRYLPSKAYNVMARRLIPPPADLLTGLRPDLTIFTNFVRTPLALSQKSIVIVYDLSYLTHPQFANVKNSQLLSKQVPKAVRRANHVVTISHNAKRELIAAYDVPNDKISVIYPAIDPAIFYPQPAAEIKRVKRKFNIDGNYVLYTGTLEPRKNINGLLDAYAQLPEPLRQKYTLVLAGGRGWRDAAIAKRLNELKTEKIILTGYVPDENLPTLYSGASLFVYPSFYEGFGMPPLEAMACGAPVITTNNSSLPESAGEAAVMVAAEDSAELSQQMKRVLTDNKLAQQLRDRGLKHAMQFRWDKSAQQLHAVIQQVAAGSALTDGVNS